MIFETYPSLAEVVNFVQTKLISTIHTCCIVSVCKSYKIERVIIIFKNKEII